MLTHEHSSLALEVIIRAARTVEDAVEGYVEPSAIYRPTLSIDGDQWCALYGDNLQDGVAGFGDSPAKAMQDFNKQWYTPLKSKD